MFEVVAGGITIGITFISINLISLYECLKVDNLLPALGWLNIAKRFRILINPVDGFEQALNHIWAIELKLRILYFAESIMS